MQQVPADERGGPGSILRDMGTEMRPRWSGDRLGRGIGDGGPALAALDALRAEMAAEGWLAEEVERHLADQLTSAARALGVEVRVNTNAAGGVVADATVGVADRRQLRAAAYRWLAELVEGQTFVREEPLADGARFLIATGRSGDELFAPHGHLIELHLRWQRI